MFGHENVKVYCLFASLLIQCPVLISSEPNSSCLHHLHVLKVPDVLLCCLVPTCNKKQNLAMQDNMLKCLLNMASSLHGGETHMLVQRLLDVADNLVEGMNLREELSNALAAEEASEKGHDHDHHHHHHGSGGDCGHDHSHDHSHHHSHDHSHDHSHTHAHSSNDTLVDNSSDSGSKDTLDAGTGSDAKR